VDPAKLAEARKNLEAAIQKGQNGKRKLGATLSSSEVHDLLEGNKWVRETAERINVWDVEKRLLAEWHAESARYDPVPSFEALMQRHGILDADKGFTEFLGEHGIKRHFLNYVLEAKAQKTVVSVEKLLQHLVAMQDYRKKVNDCVQLIGGRP
jgi:hypothetical protein